MRRDGRDVAELTLGWIRESATVRIDGVPHELRRAGLASGDYTLSRGGAVVATARKPSSLRSRFEIEHEGHVYELAKAAWWGRRFRLREGGQTIGSIGPHHLFTRRSAIDLPAELGLPVQVFVAALVAFMWKRDAGAAAGGGAG